MLTTDSHFIHDIIYAYNMRGKHFTTYNHEYTLFIVNIHIKHIKCIKAIKMNYKTTTIIILTAEV